MFDTKSTTIAASCNKELSIIKRKSSIPDEVSAELDQTIPNQERSKFVTQTLSEALKPKKQGEARSGN